MSTPSIIATIILIIAVGAIIGIRIYMHRKDNGGTSVSIEQFVAMYGTTIIATLQDAISLLNISSNDFEDREDYEKTLIEYTVDMIKEHYNEIGINIDIIDTSKLAEIVYMVFHSNLVEIFSKMSPSTISNHSELFDETVVAALTEAE